MAKLRNLSDGVTDGIALFYVKNKKVYSIIWNEEQLEFLDVVVGMVPGKIKVLEKEMAGIEFLDGKKMKEGRA